MKTIELDLEKEQKLDYLIKQIRNINIKLGKDEFELIIYSYFDFSNVLYASFLLLLGKYMAKEMNREANHNKPDWIFEDKMNRQYFEVYAKHDINKLENKLEKDFNFKIEIEKRNPSDEVFGIWKNESISIDKIRKKAWQRAK